MTEAIQKVANPWKAGCGESRMPGLERGVGKHHSVVRPAPTLLTTPASGSILRVHLGKP
jgi:hypothetical protein